MLSCHGSGGISRLPSELLLEIFESYLTSATLARCVPCCRRWKPLAISVLYRHVVLASTQQLSRWAATAPLWSDLTIQTLTIYVTDVRVARWFEFHFIPMKELLRALDRLSTRLQHMDELKSFSMITPTRLSQPTSIPNLSMAKILRNIPETCSSLELVIRQDRHPVDVPPSKPNPHLCVFIRRLIPQLQTLRLDLPRICSESFGTVLRRSTSELTPVAAPKLQDCIITIGSPNGRWVALKRNYDCNPDAAFHGIGPFFQSLRAFTASGQAPLLRKLWVCDALPRSSERNVSYAAFVRRDVLANKSHTFPWAFITLPIPHIEKAILIRTPAEEGGQDFLTTSGQGAENFVEGCAWMTATTGARLPASTMAKYGLERRPYFMLSKAEWEAGSTALTTLWENERDTGMRLLEGETGSLLAHRTANLRVPQGWRPNYSFTGFERIR